MHDNVTHPKHYQLEDGTEAIDHIRSMLGDEKFKGYLLGNVMKYITRADKKNGIEDIKKAHFYMGLYLDYFA